jgi:maleylpyruvate isomerase
VTDRHDVTATVPWMLTGTAHLLAAVDNLGDADLRGPSALPDWSRAHVVGHVARNAEALARLATWARTGVETPMYADRAQRAAEIERSAALPADTLRTQLTDTAAALDAALTGLTAAQWHAVVRSALGRAIPAAEVPWMRIREVWLHAVDLDTGARMDDLPAEVVDLLLDDVTTVLSARDDCPALQLAPTDRERTWPLGGPEPTGTVSATAADIAGWLTGRITEPDRPALPRWL